MVIERTSSKLATIYFKHLCLNQVLLPHYIVPERFSDGAGTCADDIGLYLAVISDLRHILKRITMIHSILQDSFVKRCVVYFVVLVLLGIIFAQLFQINLDLSNVLGSITNTLP